ncbi:polysaccharide deacetylase family protein [Streptomyces sp. NPDC002889]|uniref:polysaccharide deacetylase family protein n=1 Tax=Streptomyces sp. NPDC002889 TaxID=3364669 RepID=UPI003689E17C
MGRSRSRGTNGRVLVAAVGVAGLTALAAAWTTQAAPAGAGPAAPPKPKPIAGQTSVPDPKLPAPAVSMDIAHASDKGPKGVNITIDDGPDPAWTPQVLAVLKENGVKATFCMVGTQAQAHPDLVKAVVSDGHRLCDHSVSHDTTMDTASRARQAKEILDAERMITEASGGVEPLYYRAPGGAFTPYSRQLAASRGMRPLGWNVDSKDFKQPGAATMVETVKNEISNGPTVLFHDAGGDRSQTVDALRQVLPWLRQQGYVFGFPVR